MKKLEKKLKFWRKTKLKQAKNGNKRIENVDSEAETIKKEKVNVEKIKKYQNNKVENLERMTKNLSSEGENVWK